MDMMEFLRTRRTYRRFDQRPIAPEILTEAIDAARLASCGANRQTVRYTVLQDTRLPGCSDVDVGLALGSLTAAAWAHGVGSCIMGAIDRPALTELLALPEGLRLCYMVALGYPAHKSRVVTMQDSSVKYYLDENRDYCVPKRSMAEVLLKTL